MSRNQKKKYEKGGIYDSGYIAYCEHGDSAAVFIMRDIQKNVDTEGKWIDVIAKEIREPYTYWHDFEFFDVELFPKKIYPVYMDDMTDEEKKYETWKTAQEDISMQRFKGYKGRKYRVYPYIDKHYIPPKQTVEVDMILEMFDPETNEWVDRGHGPIPKGFKYRKKEIEIVTVAEAYEFLEYKIRLIKRIK